MAVRQEIETQREVTALIRSDLFYQVIQLDRNLSCHSNLRSILLERRVVDAIKAAEVQIDIISLNYLF